MFEQKHRTQEDLQKKTIRVEVAEIDRVILERVEAIIQEHLQKCINENWQHLKDIFSKIKFVKC